MQFSKLKGVKAAHHLYALFRTLLFGSQQQLNNAVSKNWSTWFRAGYRELPYADSPEPGSQNEWAWLRSATGKTHSESKLLQLVRGSVLSLWSIPGPYISDGLNRNGGGKELCDLLVIFGNDVLVFSDKDCSFPLHIDPKVAWCRWYRRAIAKSANQLAGAARTLTKTGVQLYCDVGCTSMLPLRLPDPKDMRVHLIAVAHGSVEAAVNRPGI